MQGHITDAFAVWLEAESKKECYHGSSSVQYEKRETLTRVKTVGMVTGRPNRKVEDTGGVSAKSGLAEHEM